jgi:hypothetical protein
MRLQPFATLTPLILICHCPPRGTPLDRVGEGMHYGSTAIRRFIDEHAPAYFFCGHIHEAEGVRATIGRTAAVNVGKRGFLLEIDGGSVNDGGASRRSAGPDAGANGGRRNSGCQGKVESSGFRQSRKFRFWVSTWRVRGKLLLPAKRRRALVATNPIKE